MKKHRRLLDKSPILGFSKRILVLIAIFSVVFVSGSAFALDNGRSTKEAEFFGVNYDTKEIDFKLQVKSPDVPDTGNHGFLTSEVENLGSENKTFISPIIICLIATIVAFLVLTKAKTFQRKNIQSSKSFGLYSSNRRTFQKIKNPALLLAICFGLGVSSPFFIFESISSIATTGVEKINFKEHDFDADIEKGINPFGIALKEAKSQSTSDTDFSITEVKLEAETYNPTGYLIFIDAGCIYTNQAISQLTGETTTICDEEASTDLVGEKAKIPSIKEDMSIEDFKKQKKAGWGWSKDGKNFHSVDTPLTFEDLTLENPSVSIYFAVKSSAEIPGGTYKITNQITAVTNDVNNEFAEYRLAYDDGTSETKTFYKREPGHFKIKSPADSTGFDGWAETGGSDKATYQPGDDFEPTLLTTILYAVRKYDYQINFKQGYYFHEYYVDDISTPSIVEPCDTTNYQCGEDEEEIKRRAGLAQYDLANDKEGEKHFEYYVKDKASKTEPIMINLNEKDSKGDYLYVPRLKGYTFLGWTDFDFTKTESTENSCKISDLESHDDAVVIYREEAMSELEAAIVCLKDNGNFYEFDSNANKFVPLASEAETQNGESEEDSSSEQNEEENTEDDRVFVYVNSASQKLTLHAVYKLNPIQYRIDYYSEDDTSSTPSSSSSVEEPCDEIKTSNCKIHNGRIANAVLKTPAPDKQWVSRTNGGTYTNEERLAISWEDMLNATSDNGNSTLGIESLDEKTIVSTGSTSGRTLSSNSKSTTKNLLLALNSNLENDEETTEEESEDEKQEEKTTETTEPTEPKKAEKRAAPAASSTETEKTEEEKDENLKEQTDDNGTTLLFYDDTSTVSPYYTRPLGVKEETLSEEPESNIVTTICIIVLIVSGLGITAIILFPVLSKNHAKKQTLPKF